MAFEKNLIYLATPSPADDLPSFREAFPDSSYIDDSGAKSLAAAIIVRTAQDYFSVCKNPDKIHIKKQCKYVEQEEDNGGLNALMSKDMIEKFIDGPVFESLTNIPPDYFKETIRKYANAKKSLPSISNVQKDGPLAKKEQIHF